MRKKGWIIDSFRFPFNGVNFIVLVILYLPGEEKDQYALVKLDFLYPDNFNYHLLVPANFLHLIEDDFVLRKFFDLPEANHPGNALQTLTWSLGCCTPSRIINGKGTRGKPHCPTLESIMAMTRVLRLNAKESQELFYAAYPQFPVWEEAIQKKWIFMRQKPFWRIAAVRYFLRKQEPCNN